MQRRELFRLVMGVALSLQTAGTSWGQPSKGRVLFVLTSTDQLRLTDGKMVATGTYAEEFLEPYQALLKAGYSVTIVTPSGLPAPFDAKSTEKDPKFGLAVQNAPELKKVSSLEQLDCNNLCDYCAVVIPGGHGPMQDLAHSAALGRLLVAAQKDGLLIAAICHGVAGLLPAWTGEGWIFSGYQLTGFSKAEEDLTPVAGLLPFELEPALKAHGARYQKAPPKSSLVVRDRRLLTGQNPASAKEFARQLVAALEARP